MQLFFFKLYDINSATFSELLQIVLWLKLDESCACVCVFADYFAKHMGDYEGVLASLETLNLSILKAMDFTKKVRVSARETTLNDC